MDWTQCPGVPRPRADDCNEHVWATNNICIVPRLANLALQRGSRGVGGALVVQTEGEGGGLKSNLIHHPCCHGVPAHTTSPTGAWGIAHNTFFYHF